MPSHLRAAPYLSTPPRSNRLLWLLPLLLPALSALAAENNGCLDCHSDPDLTIERGGRTLSLQVDPEVFTHTPHQGFACADCHDGLDPDAFPHADPMPRVDCVACHMEAGDTHPFHPQVALVRAGAPIPAAGDCVTCHGSHAIDHRAAASFPFTPARQTESCGVCHAVESAEYQRSAHARALTRLGAEQAPDCLNCHNDPNLQINGDPLRHKTSLVALCGRCHRDNPEVAGRTLFGTPFIVAFENSVHGQALLAGNPEAPSCADCHGSHAVEHGMIGDSPVSRRRVAETCSACHTQAEADFRHSAHGVAFARGNRDSPTCTDCHGEHNILPPGDPNAPISARNLAQQVCGDCHGSVRLSQRYGIASNTFNTFADSYHGLAGRSGAVDVVNCASCHGYHNVLNSADPLSLVHPDNLAATCGACHPGANERFAIGKVHVALDRTSEEPVLYWIATIYVWLIVIVIGSMVLHNLIDFIRKAKRKALAHWNDVPHFHGNVPHRLHLRMTVNERLQHAVLGISFVLLVVTGFMLRYPEAWWVDLLRRMSDHMFEWRGLLHRIAGVVMILCGVWHAVYLAATERGRQLFRDVLPRWSDVTDLLGTVRYNLGMAAHKPLYARFSYVEKAEYWAMIWGTFLMTLTGFLLWFDNFTMGLFTKLGFDIFRIVHFYEAVLATLAIIVWHFYAVIFNPDVYPMNMAWLTGKMSEEEMLHEHPLELQRILREQGLGQPDDATPETDAEKPEDQEPRNR
jgi:cytochrome b subunit of formate dehydrogenase